MPGAGQEDGDFLAAEPADQVPGPQLAAQDRGGRGQDGRAQILEESRAEQALAAAHTELAQLRGTGSHLARIPLPDQDEQHELIITAFTTKARDDLGRLAQDIAAAQHDQAGEAAVTALYKRFRACKPPPPSTPSS